MLIDLLNPMPGQAPITGTIDRLFTGNYKSNGNLVSLKVDIIDFTDFQRHGCLASGGCGGGSGPHNHSVSGTLYCHPDSNTVRLNLTLLPGPCTEQSPGKCWQPEPGSTTHLKDVKSWAAELQPALSLGSSLAAKHSLSQLPVYSAPVSPPSQADDAVPPPLLDFHSEQLMSEIQNMTFDLKDSALSQLYSSESLPISLAQACPATSSQPQPSQPTTVNPLVKPYTVTTLAQCNPASLSGPGPSLPALPANQVQPKSNTTTAGQCHPTLLQPKLERSDSICSDYTPLKEEFLSYTGDLARLDELDNESPSLTPPSTLSSPLLFSQNPTKSILSSSDKNGIFFNKSFDTKPQSKSQDAFDNLFSSSQTTTSQTFTNGNFSLSINDSRKGLGGSPGPELSVKAGGGYCGPRARDSPASSTESSVSSPVQETPITLLTSPKSRNRRNSSFDETKPHVCGQCGARFTTKSNLGQHAKIHLAVKPFICEICSHGFTRAAHYESHVAKHKGLKTHRCDQCGESFARLDNLLRHSARHKHGKIFDCAVCGKGFHRKDKLLEHEKVHSEYTFPCQKCSKTFHTNDALKHHLPLHEDNTKTQCKICLKFITIKSLSKHMSAFHKEAVTNLNENNNNNNNNSVSNNKSKSRSRTNNNPSNEKLHGCQYCKKSFVSPAKLRLHTGKYHAEERRCEAVAVQGGDQTAGPASAGQDRLRFFPESEGGGARARYGSPSSDGLPSQQVPELEMSYVNSSPEDISDFGTGKEMSGLGGSGSYSSIPTIHIPEFDNLQSKMGDNSEISTEAIQALFFS